MRWGRGPSAPRGLGPAPASAAALGWSLTPALPRRRRSIFSGFGQQPVGPLWPGSHRWWLGRRGTGVPARGEAIYWHIPERRDPFLGVAWGSGPWGHLQVFQLLPQFAVTFLFGETVHRQQIEAATTVWEGGPGQTAPPVQRSLDPHPSWLSGDRGRPSPTLCLRPLRQSWAWEPHTHNEGHGLL